MKTDRDIQTNFEREGERERERETDRHKYTNMRQTDRH